MRKEFLVIGLTLIISAVFVISACSKEDVVDDKPIELTPREKAIKDWEENYIGSYVPDPGWTGKVSGCDPGTISQDSRNKTLQRLNYFRRLVGLSDNVTENPDQHAGCQRASLIFKAQNQLDHHPGPGWACYAQDGAAAAATANIGWGTATSGTNASHTANSISHFIEDAGANNKAVGHRAWFFMPGLNKLGIGSTNSTNCMQWKDNYTQSGPSPEFIAYPPEGFMPSKIVYPRWSFTLPTGGNYTNATVTMKDQAGANVQLSVINKPTNQTGYYPLRHLVWEPNVSVEYLMEDVKYTVTIDNITQAPKSSYTYEVTIIPVQGISKRVDPGMTLDEIIVMSVFK